MPENDLKKISYVEDEPDIRAVAEIALTVVGGYVLDISTCGEEALQSVPDFNPDLLLLDVMMPGLTGPDLLIRFAEDERTRGIPVIFMTAKAQRHEVAEFLALGAVGVIPKPFDPMTLAQSVADIWAQKVA